MYSQTHSGQFENKLTEDPIKPYWLDFQKRSTTAYRAWFNHWINIAETTDKPVYFFRFEDILVNPEPELRNLFKFILGLDNLDGTVIDKRIKDVMAMGAKKNQTYKPRQGGTNRNIQNYLREQIEFTKNHNEELFHIFGYVKDEENNPDSHTAFMDFEGRAKPENVAKMNYYKQLNERAFLKRKLIRNGTLADPQNKIQVGVSAPGGIRMISHLDIMNKISILDHLKFTE